VHQPVHNPTYPQAQSRFGFQFYRVLTHPDEVIRASIDPKMVGLLRRVIKGQHDCAICRTTLNLDPNDCSSPGLLGYLHGDFTKDIDVVAVAACVACVRKLGNEATAKTVSQIFADDVLGGGHVEQVQCGTA
jgi:hypothetical protein